jgi:hypothetical protein
MMLVDRGLLTMMSVKQQKFKVQTFKNDDGIQTSKQPNQGTYQYLE